jgi:hypothetical protein
MVYSLGVSPYKNPVKVLVHTILCSITILITTDWCAHAVDGGKCQQPFITICHKDFESPLTAMLHQRSLLVF